MDGKRILVTGGSRGLGLALVQHLLECGYSVAATARTRTDALEALLRAHPARLEFHPADLSDREDLRRLAREAGVLEGYDGFVSNAAQGSEGLLVLSREEDIRSSIELNLVAAVLLAREMIKGMLVRGGSLVFVSSVCARRGFRGLSVYSAAKGGLCSLSRSLAREYGGKGIRSNTVLPGFLETSMTSRLDSNEKSRIVRRTAVGRLGFPSDVVALVEYLLSERSKFVTGAEFVVDGGLTV